MNRNQIVYRGRNSLKRMPEMLNKLGMKRPMIVGGRSLVPVLMKKAPGLLECTVFQDYHPNPDLSDAEKAAGLYRAQGCDGLVAIGGGSTIDTAKAVKAILTAGDAGKAQAAPVPEKDGMPLIAVPGTAGSGAEATANSVVYADHRKLSIGGPGLLPDGVILDAGLLDSLPDYHRKACALDALSQGIESYWCSAATEDSRVNAFLAILGVLDNLKAYLAGDPHAAEEMLDASYQSGKAIRITRTTAPHAMSYQLTQLFGIAHGHACMLTLPAVWEHMNRQKAMEPVLKQLSALMRLGDPLMGPKLLRGILYDLEMEIPELPGEETLDRLVESVNPERLHNHPVPLDSGEIRMIYRQALRKPAEPERQACLDIWRYYGGNGND